MTQLFIELTVPRRIPLFTTVGETIVTQLFIELYLDEDVSVFVADLVRARL